MNADIEREIKVYGIAYTIMANGEEHLIDPTLVRIYTKDGVTQMTSEEYKEKNYKYRMKDE